MFKGIIRRIRKRREFRRARRLQELRAASVAVATVLSGALRKEIRRASKPVERTEEPVIPTPPYLLVMDRGGQT